MTEVLQLIGVLTVVYWALTFFVVVYTVLTETMFEGESRWELAATIAFTWPLALFYWLRDDEPT